MEKNRRKKEIVCSQCKFQLVCLAGGVLEFIGYCPECGVGIVRYSNKDGPVDSYVPRACRLIHDSAINRATVRLRTFEQTAVGSHVISSSRSMDDIMESVEFMVCKRCKIKVAKRIHNQVSLVRNRRRLFSKKAR